VDHLSGLQLWPIPWAVINDQHSQHTENRNRQRDQKRARECPLRLDSFLRLTRVHGFPAVFSLVKIKSRLRRMFHGMAAGFAEQTAQPRISHAEAATRRSQRRLSRIAKGL
jgi:hypothetical protein